MEVLAPIAPFKSKGRLGHGSFGAQWAHGTHRALGVHEANGAHEADGAHARVGWWPGNGKWRLVARQWKLVLGAVGPRAMGPSACTNIRMSNPAMMMCKT